MLPEFFLGFGGVTTKDARAGYAAVG